MAKRKSAGTGLGKLPEWDLVDLYPATDAKQLTRDLTRAERDARGFHRRYFGKVAKLDGNALGKAVAAFEKIDELLSGIMSYAQLVHAGDVADPEIGRFYQTTQEKVTAIAAHLVFFTLEINKIGERALAQKLKSKALAHYASWIRDTRAVRAHQLDEEKERLLHEKRVTGRAAWNRLFDETMARLRFPIDGKKLTTEEVLHRLSDTDPATRKAAAKAFGKGLGDNVPLFGLITNTLAKDKEIEDR
ncbi:MAG: oligoendopeptidase F, partial [Alphaproteobacteria bacterium]